MRAADIVTASVLLLLGGLVGADAIRLGIGWGTDGPRAGFFPFWLATVLVICCGIVVAQATRRETQEPFVTRERLRLVLKVLWPAAGLVISTHVLGLYVSAGLYLGFYMRWVGHHGWRAVLALSIGVPVAAFLIFELWFLVPMPKGPLEAWLGY
ncbi:MAG TPA: tripartite tricarboxylate transporter TctB family protein [Verrucomicrobiae bacterium]|jgi:putative tricarboxylic transport membrane protein|nr:tripartite tricarboxylate transporter TctB family protein [Verrucomicrobiae bacterium]